MIVIRILVLVILICEIKFSALQNNSSNSGYLTKPWVTVVQVPQDTPTYINLNSSKLVPMNNTFNRFRSVTLFEVDTIYNYGYVVIVMSGEDTGTYTIGGAAGLDQFKFVGVIFLWNLEMGRAGTLLDGKSTPLEVTIVYVNTKYPYIDSANYRDGFFLNVIRVNVVDGIQDNPKFGNFSEKLAAVSVAGTTANISGYDLTWLNGYSRIHENEYCYPGQLKNYTNFRITNSATICLRRTYLPVISKNQFLTAFGGLKNQTNHSYSSIEPLSRASPNTPFGIFGPEVIGYSPN